MSDVKAVRYLLASNSGLTAVVPAVRIIAGVLPENTALPAIGVTHVSTLRRNPIAAPATRFTTSRVQVTVMASTYPTQKSILALVRTALPRSRGTVNGVAVDSILSDSEGPDFTNDAGIFMGSHDFIIKLNE